MEQDETAASVGPAGRRMMALGLAMLLASLGTSIANVALPALAEAFAAPFPAIQWIVTAYLAAMTVSVAVAGRLGDRHGLRRLHLLGLGLFALASLLCALSSSLVALIMARLLQGLAAGILMTTTLALMRASAEPARLGRAMGLLGTMSALGTALGPALGGLLLAATGTWRSLFLVQPPLAGLAFVLAVLSLPRDGAREEAKETTTRTLPRGGLMANLATNLLVAAVMMTTLVVGPFYLGFGLHLTEARVGLVMAVGPAISILSGLPAGRAVDAFGAGRVLWIGLAALATGALLLALLPEAWGILGYTLGLAVLTPGYQLFQAANNTLALAQIPPAQRGGVAGLLGLSRNIGLILGASLMGALFAFGTGTATIAQASVAELGHGLRLTFLMAGGLMILALGLAATHSAPSLPQADRSN